MEQQQESYGMPYAMHVHDIGSIEKCYEQEVNTRLQRGEILLDISPEGNNEYGIEASYVFGIPRAQYCTGWDNNHKSTRKHWNHQDKKWFCPVCNPLKTEDTTS